MNLNTGNLEMTGISIFVMQQGRYMLSPKIWPLTFQSTSKLVLTMQLYRLSSDMSEQKYNNWTGLYGVVQAYFTQVC